jgi:hypothetical protein
MSRSSRPTWLAALATVPKYPFIPEGMTEPAWVHLAIEHACHVSLFFMICDRLKLNVCFVKGLLYKERQERTLGCPYPRLC